MQFVYGFSSCICLLKKICVFIKKIFVGKNKSQEKKEQKRDFYTIFYTIGKYLEYGYYADLEKEGEKE